MEPRPSAWWTTPIALGLALASTVSAETVSVSLTPAADSLAVYVSTDPSNEQRAFPEDGAAVGCNFSQVGATSEVACFASAIRFALPAELAGTTIVGAQLLLTPRLLPADFETQYQLGVWAEPWTPGDFTFARLFAGVAVFTNAAIPFGPVPSALPLGFDVTPVVQGWVDGTAPNHGFLLEPLDYDSGLGENVLRATEYFSSETAPSPAERPRLEIIYDAPDPPDPVEPPVVSFAASPDAISAGETSTLQWSAQNADGCQLDALLFGPSGRFDVVPPATTTYTLRCVGPGGSRTAEVTVRVEDVPEIELRAKPTSIERGDSTHLDWSARNARRCFLEQCTGPRSCKTETVPSRGEKEVRPKSSTRYELTCVGGGGEVSARVSVEVGSREPPADSLSAVADPERIAEGETSEVRWTWTGVGVCRVGEQGGVLVFQPASSSLVVSPERDTVYEIRCGEAVSLVTVFVDPAEAPFKPFAQGMVEGPEKLRVAKGKRREQKLRRARETSVSIGEGLWRAELAGVDGAGTLSLSGSYTVKSESRRRQKLALDLDAAAREALRAEIERWARDRLGTDQVELRRAKARLVLKPRQERGKLLVKLKLRADDGRRPKLEKSSYKLKVQGPVALD